MTRAKQHMYLSMSVSPRGREGQAAKLLKAQLMNASSGSVCVATGKAAPEIIPAPPPDAVQPIHVYIDRVAPQEQHDSTASITDISIFTQCPRKYFLSRYIGWDGGRDAGSRGVVSFEDLPKDTGELDASEIGTQVHQILAGVHIESPVAEAAELADRFHTSPLGKRALKAARKQHEYDFVVALDGLVLRGQIDLWFEHNRELILVDYKTDQVRLPIDPQRVNAYALQLQLYAIALEQIAGRPVSRAYLHFLRPNELVEVDLSPLQMNGAREHVRAFIEAQGTLAYPLRTGDHCFRCDYYKNVCPAGRNVATAVSRS
jgi:ATP-dependent exoDNAse (exonuclease V) beta subunit